MALLLRVRLTPKSDSDRIDGIRRGADGSALLQCRVRAVPEKGAANTALEALLARSFGSPKSGVTVIGGHTARVKTVRIEDGETALAALCAKWGDGPP